MKNRGKNIHLFLMDGEANERIKCTLSNWTGVAYKIPRSMLEKSKNIQYLQQTGIYFLFGYADKTAEPVVYIGQAGIRKNGQGILSRLNEHRNNGKKEFWSEAVAFTTTNNTFGPTEISYLENRFCNLAREAARYIVKNENEPTRGNITEEKESELEEFIDYSKLIMGALGYKLFEPAVKKEFAEDARVLEEALFYFKSKRAQATGKPTSSGFVVLAGSRVSLYINERCSNKGVLKLREKYKDHIDAEGFLDMDIEFSSPSYAASFVAGANMNGNEKWKTIDKVAYGEWRNTDFS